MAITKMFHKIQIDPEGAKRDILDAIRACEGNRKDAAATFGVTERAMYRWVQTLRMYEDIDDLLRSMGLDVFIGPPRKYTKRSTVPLPKYAGGGQRT